MADPGRHRRNKPGAAILTALTVTLAGRTPDAWPAPSPASSARPAAPSPANGPAAARPAANGTPSSRKPPTAGPASAGKAPRPRAWQFVGLAGDGRAAAARAPPASPSSTACWAAAWCRPRRVLVGGDPGIGKSTLLLQAAAALGRAGRRVLYISGEEAVEQVRLRARRLGLARRAGRARRRDQPARHRRQRWSSRATPRWW